MAATGYNSEITNMVHIYKITNLINGKCYIGQTSRPKRRWIEHRGDAYKNRYCHCKLHNAIKKYGADNFKFEILFSGLTREEANIKEKELIQLLQCHKKEIGYNITLGGEGHNGVFGENHPNFGKKFPWLSERNKRTKGIKLSDERKKEISVSSTGRTHSDETKRKLSEIKKKLWEDGVYSTEEYRNKQNKSKIGVPVPKLYRKIICNETGKIFKSIQDAAEVIAGNKRLGGNIVSQLKGKLKTAYGYTFNYV